MALASTCPLVSAACLSALQNLMKPLSGAMGLVSSSMLQLRAYAKLTAAGQATQRLPQAAFGPVP